MIRNRAYWEQWKKERIRNEPVDIEHNFAIMDAMYHHARALGVFPLADPLEGLDVRIKLAKAVNVSLPAREDREGS